MGLEVESSADEEHAEAVVVAVSESAGDAAVEFDEAVDGFGAAVGRAAGFEVGQERGSPGSQGLAESGDLGDGTVREGPGDPACLAARGAGVFLVVDRSELLGALVGDGDFVVGLVRGDRCVQAPLLGRAESFGAGAQDGADPVQRVAPAAAVTRVCC